MGFIILGADSALSLSLALSLSPPSQTHPPVQLGSVDDEGQLQSEVVGCSLLFAPHFLDIALNDAGSCLAFPNVCSCALGTHPDITKLSANDTVSPWLLLPGLDVDKQPPPHLSLFSLPLQSQSQALWPFPFW